MRLFAVRFMRCAWKFYTFLFKCVCSSYCFYADLTIDKFCNTKRIITVTTIVKGLKNKVLRQWKGLQTRCSNMLNPQKDDYLRNWMGGLVRWTIQKLQRVHQLECLYASFMILLRYYLCLFYTIMLLKRSSVTLFHTHQSIFYFLKEGGQFEH